MELSAIPAASSYVIDHKQLEESPSVERPSYEEITCRIPPRDLERIEAKMEGLTHLEEKLEEIQGQLASGDYNSLDKDAFYYALRGVKEGKIDPKVLFRISDIETLRLQGVKFTVFDPLKKYPGTIDLRNFIYNATGKHINTAREKGVPTDMLWPFIEALKKLPQEDRWIMAFEPARSKPKFADVRAAITSDTRPTITQLLESHQKMNVFGRIKDPERGNQYVRLSASLELFQLVVQKRFGDAATIPNRVLGISTLEQIERNGETHTRDICHFYLVPDDKGNNQLVTYDEADNYECEENDFNQHDRYHLWVTSSIGPKGRLASAILAIELKMHILKRKEALSPQDLAAMENIHEHFVDMDAPMHYIHERNAREKRGAVGLAHEIELEKQKMHPNAALISGILQLFPLSHDVTISAKMLGDPEVPPFARKAAETIVSTVNLKPFETREALDETFRLVATHLREDPQLRTPLDMHLGKMAHDTLTKLHTHQSQQRRGIPPPYGLIDSLKALGASIKVMAST